MKSDKEDASSAQDSTNLSYHQQLLTTLSMIAEDLEKDLMKLQSLFAKVITKVFGTNQK